MPKKKFNVVLLSEDEIFLKSIIHVRNRYWVREKNFAEDRIICMRSKMIGKERNGK